MLVSASKQEVHGNTSNGGDEYAGMGRCYQYYY